VNAAFEADGLTSRLAEAFYPIFYGERTTKKRPRRRRAASLLARTHRPDRSLTIWGLSANLLH